MLTVRVAVVWCALLVVAIPIAVKAVPLSPGEIVVSGTGANAGQGLIRIDPVSGTQTLIASGAFGDFALADRNTAYALEGQSVVRIDVGTGAKTVISTGGLLANPTGIAVDPLGRLGVLDCGAGPCWTTVGVVLTVDPTTGGQEVLSAGGLIGPVLNTDLEIDSGGHFVMLSEIAPVEGDSRVIAIDHISGDQLDIYLDSRDSPAADGEFLFYGTGIGITPTDDIYVPNGTAHALGVLRIDGDTWEATGAGGIVATAETLPPDESAIEFTNNDMAFADNGDAWFVGLGFNLQSGLLRWDGAPLYEPGDQVFSEGWFNEVQVVSSALPVPEPGTGLLVAVGLGTFARRGAERRRRS